MHSNSDLSLAPHVPLAQEKVAGIWQSISAWFARLAKPSRYASAVLVAQNEHAAVDTPLYEQEFATEREALTCSSNAMAQGFRTVVEQSVYDYSWHVEVYPAPARDESGTLAA